MAANLPALRKVSVVGCRGLDRNQLRTQFGGIDLHVVG